MNWINNLLGLSTTSTFKHFNSNIPQEGISMEKPKGIDDRPVRGSLPGRRISASSQNIGKYTNLVMGDKFTFPSCLPTLIPCIRHLMMTNPDVSQVMYNIVSLGNTGHKIFFDRKVPPDEVDKMRNHLINKRKTWATGQAGMHGLINKMFYQILIGGALSNEWVPNIGLTGVECCSFVNPEEIVFKINSRGTGYDIYQRPPFTDFSTTKRTSKNFPDLIKLNPNTFKYYALNGDTDLPNGVPLYIPVLPKIETQENMNKNINYVVDEFGLLGLLEVLIQKPDQDYQIDANDAAYASRLENLLTEANNRISQGIKDGTVVGFKDDHEFRWNSIGKEFDKAVVLYKNNELQTFSALKHDPSLAGRDYNTSESQIGVVFMKMLSELKNIQNLIKANLEFGYALELMLAGYKFDYLKVEFNKSTLQDDLKYQQSQEIKLRNIKDKLIMGIINQEMAADELDYEKAAFDKPQVPWEVLAGGSVPNTNDNAKNKKDQKSKKTANDKKNRHKQKPISKINK